MSCQTLAKPLVNCWFFFAFLEQKNPSGNCCPTTTKVQLKVNVENMFGRKKELAINVLHCRRLGNLLLVLPGADAKLKKRSPS